MHRLTRTLVAAAFVLLAWPSTLYAQAATARASLTTTTCAGAGCVVLNTRGLGSVAVQVDGTFVGTLTFEGSLDGTTYRALLLLPSATTTAVTTATSTGMWLGNIGGLQTVRVRFSAWTSGTATTAISASTSGSGGGTGGSGGGGGTGLTDTELRASAVPISVATIPSHAVTNAGTFAVQASATGVASATLANVASSATSVTCQASNAARKGWAVTNDSTAVLYLKFGATASATSYTVQLAAGAYYEMPGFAPYTGIIDCLWSSANGNARVTEY